MNLIKRSCFAVTMVATLSMAAACGGSERPTVDELKTAVIGSDEVLKDKLYDDAVTCMAKVLHKSKLSDETLQEVVDTDGKAFSDSADELPADDQKVVESKEFSEAMNKCVEETMETMENDMENEMDSQPEMTPEQDPTVGPTPEDLENMELDESVQ